ncbi:ester cyclase [Tenacibaculum sp.]|uniref:ester cyclase n=1 Tax=Tenacibaculum sp. TaxID=1906242 RepID=UPI003D0C0A9F
MKAESNKKVIQNLYNNVLNQRNFQEFTSVISKNYSNHQGEKGVNGFKKNIMNFIHAFPDAKWALTDIMAKDDKVFVKQKVTGTHKGIFQNIQPTNQLITNEGMGIYELKDGKIISHQIQTNQLDFLQQLGVIPKKISPFDSNTIFFVDRFTMPKSSFSDFFEKMEMNRNFIRNLEGFISDEKMIKEEENGNITVMTVAIWENQKSLNNAKALVLNEYQKTGFNPSEFYKKLNITMQREIFKNTIQ